MKKASFQGVKKPDITSPVQLREQARYFNAGRLQGRAKWLQVVLVLLISLFFIAAAALYIVRTQWAAPNLMGDRYQAVFLDDGKVFFGKFKNTNGEYITLENAYYPKTSGGENGAESGEQTALIKVGSETYGPENSIQIARSKIQFWQNLRSDSKIVNAINTKDSN